MVAFKKFVDFIEDYPLEQLEGEIKASQLESKERRAEKYYKTRRKFATPAAADGGPASKVTSAPGTFTM